MAWCPSKEGVADLQNIPMSTWAITLLKILPIFVLLLSGKGLFILRMKRMVSTYFSLSIGTYICNKAKKFQVNIFFMLPFSCLSNYCVLLKSDNLQYNMLGRWDNRLVDQGSDVPSIIIFFS